MPRRPKRQQSVAHDAIAALAKQAETLSRTARRNGKSLKGANFYADKLAQLRTDAAVAFRELGAAGSVGDVAVLTELLDAVFSPSSDSDKRRDAVRELSFQLKTKWHTPPAGPPPGEEDVIFPLALLARTGRGYLVSIARQMNGSFVQGWYDACAVMMRRLVEVSIIEAYEGKGIQAKVKKPNGDYFQLTELVGHALAEPAFNLSRNTKRPLPDLRDLGHMSAHGRHFTADKTDIEKIRGGCRVVVQEFLTIGGLL